MDSNIKINYILFFVISFVIILGYSIYFSPNTKKDEQAQNQEIEINNLEKTQSVKSVNTDLLDIEAAEDISKESEYLINVKSKLYNGLIDPYGGRIVEWYLENYNESTDNDSVKYSLLKDLPPNFNLRIKSDSLAIPNPIPYYYSGRANIEVEDEAEQIVLTWNSKDGLSIEKTLSFSPNSYLITSTLTITNNSEKVFKEKIYIETYGVFTKNKLSNNKFISLVSEKIEQTESIPKEPILYPGNVKWFGFLDKYFLYTYLPETGVETTVKLYSVHDSPYIRAVYSYPFSEIKPNNSEIYKSKIYLGPLDYKILQISGSGLENAVDYGYIGFLAKPVLVILNYLNQIFHNYGISIIVITILLRVVFLPLTLKSMASMKRVQVKMQELKPKMDALKEKYKDDKAKQNSELMKLYSSHGVNPLSSLGGCFPILLQIPVFIALYQVLLNSIDLRHSKFLWINDLSEPETLFDIPGIGIPFRTLPLVMGVSWFISQKLTPTTAPGSDQMQMQMKMMQFMPIVFTVMFWGLPSGLILYWTVSNILSIAQQLYVNKRTKVH